MELEEFLAFLREIERTYRHVDDVGIADGPGSDDPPGPFPAAVGPRGDLAALLAQDPADRLDRVILGFYEVDEAHDQRVRGSSSPAKSCGPAQDLDALAQPTVLGLERHYLGQLLARRTGTLPAVDLGLDHSPAHRLLADAELLGHGRRSCRERGVLPLVVSDETYCSGRGCLIHFVSSRYEHAVIGGIVHHADVLTPRRRQLPAPRTRRRQPPQHPHDHRPNRVLDSGQPHTFRAPNRTVLERRPQAFVDVGAPVGCSTSSSSSRLVRRHVPPKGRSSRPVHGNALCSR
jgi:hypothetical protein